MIEKQKTVYYCEFCKTRRMLKNAMARHEERCVRNPARICRWGSRHEFDTSLVGVIRNHPITAERVAWLRGEVHGKCPACMLAVFLQAEVPLPIYDPENHGTLWSYSDEIAAYREHERSVLTYDY